MESATIEKAFGSFLLLVGLTIIGYSLYMGINIFINTQNPPEIFKSIAVADSAPIDNSAGSGSKPLPKNLSETNPADLQKMISGKLLSPEMLKSVIPPEMFGYSARIMNLTVFSVFLWLLITIGAKISSLGIALIKTNPVLKL